MTSNTVEIESHPVNFPSFSVEKRTYKSDPFTIKDGRSVGSDGFVVPKDFAEFHERFPDYVHKWVSKHAATSASQEDIDDWTQDLLIHLRYLPTASKHREAGKEDVVQTFDSHKHYGASSARFFNYINLCLANKFRSMHSRRIKNPLCRPGNLSLTVDCEDMGRNQVDDEFCHGHSEHLRRRCQRQERLWDARHAIAEFSEFVKREDSSMLPAMEAIAAVGTSGAAAELLGKTKADFCRMRSRLRQLGTCFQTGGRVPGRRRPYKRRLTTRISFRVR
jgi:hypothetical protein